MPVSFKDILEAFELSAMSSGGSGECQAFVCKESGQIYWRFDDVGLCGEPQDELPEDIDNEDKYLALPDKRELDLGKPLVMDFARDFLAEDLDQVREIFSRRGAYGRFKDLLARRRKIDEWHDFENEATKRAVREWCSDNLIELTD